MQFTKKQSYSKLYYITQRTIVMLHHCKDPASYNNLSARLIKKIYRYYTDELITDDMLNFLNCKISMCNVECGIWDSSQERATAYHTSRRYNQNKFI